MGDGAVLAVPARMSFKSGGCAGQRWREVFACVESGGLWTEPEAKEEVFDKNKAKEARCAPARAPVSLPLSLLPYHAHACVCVCGHRRISCLPRAHELAGTTRALARTCAC